MKVFISNRGNIDFGQDPTKPIYGTFSDYFVKVKNEEEASSVCRAYIEENDIGGGAWTGGQIFVGKELVSYVSYNGMVWDKESKHLDGQKNLYDRLRKEW